MTSRNTNTQPNTYAPESSLQNAQVPQIENVVFELVGRDLQLPGSANPAETLETWDSLTKRYREHLELGASTETRDREVQRIISTRIRPGQATILNIKSTQLPLCKQNLELFRDAKPTEIREAAIRKTQQFLQENPSILPDLTNSLSTLGLRNRKAVDDAWSAVEKAQEQFGAIANVDTDLRTQLAAANNTIAAKDIAYDEFVAKTDLNIKPILEHGQAVDIERENERQEAQDRIAKLEKVNSDLRASLERSQTDMQQRDGQILELEQKFRGAEKLAEDTNNLLATSEATVETRTEELATRTQELADSASTHQNLTTTHAQLVQYHAGCAGALTNLSNLKDAWRQKCETTEKRVDELVNELQNKTRDLEQAQQRATEAENKLAERINRFKGHMTAQLDREVQLRDEHATRLGQLHNEALQHQQTETELTIRLAQHERRYERAENRAGKAEQALRTSNNRCQAFQNQFNNLKLVLNPADQFPTLQAAAEDVSSRLSATMLEVGETGWYINTMEACEAVAALPAFLECAVPAGISSADMLRSMQQIKPQRFATIDGLLMVMSVRHLLLLKQGTNELAYVRPEQFEVELDAARGFRVAFKAAPMMGNSATSFWPFTEGIAFVPVVFEAYYGPKDAESAPSSG